MLASVFGEPALVQAVFIQARRASEGNRVPSRKARRASEGNRLAACPADYRGSIFFLPIHGTRASGTTIEPSEHW